MHMIFAHMALENLYLQGGALFIRAAKLFQVVHGKSYRYKVPRKQKLGGKNEE